VHDLVLYNRQGYGYYSQGGSREKSVLT